MSKQAHPLIISAIAEAFPKYRNGLRWSTYPADEECGAFAHGLISVRILGEEAELELIVRPSGEVVLAETGNVISGPGIAPLADEACRMLAQMEAEAKAEADRKAEHARLYGPFGFL